MICLVKQHLVWVPLEVDRNNHMCQDCTQGNLQFVEPHPQRATQYLVRRKKPVVVELCGKAISDPELDDDSRERYAKAVLIHFVPWRDPMMIQRGFNTWHEALQDYLPNATETVERDIRNLNTLLECRRKHAIDFESYYQGENTTIALDNGRVIKANQLLFEEENDVHDGFTAQEVETLLDKLTKRSDKNAEKFMVAAEEGIKNLRFAIPLPRVIPPNRVDPALKLHIPTWKGTYKKPEVIIDRVIRAEQQRYGTYEYAVNIEEEKPPSVRYTEEHGQDLFKKVYNAIVQKKNLNTEQRFAFALVLKHMVQTWKAMVIPNYAYPPQLLSTTQGQGGSGKSVVIGAIVEGAELIGFGKGHFWIGAFTGVAACNVGGSTLHRILGLERGKKQISRHNKAIQKGREWKYGGVDEIGTVGQNTFVETHEKCLMARGIVDTTNAAPFGGLNLITFGDFNQLPPVSDTPIHKRRALTGNKESDARSSLAQLLWSQFKDVVQLKHSMRQANDPEFIKFLEEIRHGRKKTISYEESILEEKRITRLCEYLERKIVGIDLEQLDESWNVAPIIVATNAMRLHLNEYAASRIATGSGFGVTWIKAEDKLKVDDTKQLRGKILDLLAHTPDSATGNIPGRFPLVQGMPVVIQNNICLEFGIANGTTGKLVGWLLHREEPAYDETKEHVLKYLPEVLLVKLDKAAHYVQFEGLEPGIVPIFPDESNFDMAFMKMKIGVRRKGFKIGVAIAYTVHKVQGMTHEKVIVDLDKSFKYQNLVVALSRVRTGAGLKILKRFDRSVLNTCPSEDLLNWDTELEQLHEATIKRHPELWKFINENGS